MPQAQSHPGSTTVQERVLSSPLRREVSVALAVKLLVLGTMWYVFFSDPLDRDLDHRDVERMLILSQPVVTSSTIPASNFPPAAGSSRD